MERKGDRLLERWSSLPALPDHAVQVFALHTASEPGLVARAERFLSRAELERAARIRAEHAREEFMVGRAALRVLLGAAVGSEPQALSLQVDAFGKPFVPGVHSNVSHSHGVIYVALCRAAPVGIDVEWIDPGLEALDIAEANFMPEETARIAAETAGFDRSRAFCQVWTRKEAVAKAYGQGLRVALRDIAVPIEATGTAFVRVADGVTTGKGPDARVEFSLLELAAPPGFAAALAVRGPPLPTRIVY